MSTQERQKLVQIQHPEDLLKQLQEEHNKNANESAFQKGASKIQPVLRKLKDTLEVANPVFSIEPSAGAALGIVQMATTIEKFFEALPRIELCDAAQSEYYRQDIVQKALIDVYGDLLKFFFNCCKVLQSKHATRDTIISKIWGDTASIVDSFSGHLDSLEKTINVDTNAVVRRQGAKDQDKEVRELLRPTDAEVSYVDGLRKPFEGACEWIHSNELFQDWLKATPRTRHVMLCGDMGVGKTWTMAYIEDRLESGDLTPRGSLVCSYFCKEGGEMNQAKSIYRGLLRKLLAAKVSIRGVTRQWHENTQEPDPTQCTDKLREHLITLVKSLRQPLYIVIDALDECSDDAREELKIFFRAVCPSEGLHKPDEGSPAYQSQSCLVRLLTSARYTDDIRDWIGLETISMRPDKDRDLFLVQDLANRDLRMDQAAVEVVVKQVAQEMQGSALWASTVIQWLKKLRVTTEADVRENLQDIPPPGELVRLFGKLFEKVVAGNWKNRLLLGMCLDLLAGARRSLTLRELSYAAWTSREHSGEKVKSLVEMQNRAEDWKRILRLIRPFISVKGTPEDGIGPDTLLVLSHQSIRRSIMSIPPRDWNKVAPGTMTRDAKPVREVELNGLLLRHCMDYLLLEEFDKQELLDAYNLFAQSLHWFFGPSPVPWGRKKWTAVGSNSVSDDFDWYAKGFGSFYTYAACCWTDHYAAIPREHAMDYMDVVALLQPGSLRRGNWINRRCLPDCGLAFDARFESAATKNSISLVAWCGHFDALKAFLDLTPNALGLENEEQLMAAIIDTATRSILSERFEVAEVLLNHPRTASGLEGNDPSLGLLGREWESQSSETGGPVQQLLILLVERCQSALDRFASHILLVAATIGCLPMVQRLFEVARCDQRITRCLLEPSTDLWGPIGRAAMFDHIEILKYLCQQGKMMEVHLHHHTKREHSIYLDVVLRGNVDILRVVIRYFPEGINDANDFLTPLQTAVLCAKSIEAARVLLLEGKADINAGDPSLMPLKCAVSQGDIDMCRMLIVEGKADPRIVVGITEHPERPDSKAPFLLQTS